MIYLDLSKIKALNVTKYCKYLMFSAKLVLISSFHVIHVFVTDLQTIKENAFQINIMKTYA